MAPPRSKDDVLKRTKEVYLACGKNQVEAAARLGIARSTLQHRLKKLPDLPEHGPVETWTPPRMRSPDPSPDELVEHMCQRFTQRAEAWEDRRCIEIAIDTDQPIGLVWFGDPHVDDDGCDWPTLKRHVEIVNSTPGMNACSLGDAQNNWVGRLSSLYGYQETSKRQAWKLVEWLMRSMPWRLIIKGNHDSWQGAGDPLDYMKEPGTVMNDWSIRARLRFANGFVYEIDARHDHPGHSMWNQLHAQRRALAFAGGADLYIAGHRHVWGLQQVEDAERDKVVWFARARGYKFMDNYALVKGFEEQRYGHAIATIINPRAKEPADRATCFASIERAASYLTYLRSAA